MYDPYNPYEEKPPGIEINFKKNRGSQKKSGIGTVNAGGAIIIIIFVVLCLTIFGLLSFATSFADKKLADKNSANVSLYYDADLAAEERLAMLCDAVNSGLGGGTPLDQAVRSAAGQMDFEVDLGLFEADENMESAKVRYRVEMGAASGDAKANFYLDCEITFYRDKNTGKLSYEIYGWRVSMDSGFDYDEGRVDVWDGNFGYYE
ncbi:MAG: hypothetical protein FWG34_03480 [Oscillospiraceae bacterium]|nr:hypothetical protein [Oscillospiraceae bacterium]